MPGQTRQGPEGFWNEIYFQGLSCCPAVLSSAVTLHGVFRGPQRRPGIAPFFQHFTLCTAGLDACFSVSSFGGVHLSFASRSCGRRSKGTRNYRMRVRPLAALALAATASAFKYNFVYNSDDSITPNVVQSVHPLTEVRVGTLVVTLPGPHLFAAF